MSTLNIIALLRETTGITDEQELIQLAQEYETKETTITGDPETNKKQLQAIEDDLEKLMTEELLLSAVVATATSPTTTITTTEIKPYYTNTDLMKDLKAYIPVSNKVETTRSTDFDILRSSLYRTLVRDLMQYYTEDAGGNKASFLLCKTIQSVAQEPASGDI